MLDIGMSNDHKKAIADFRELLRTRLRRRARRDGSGACRGEVPARRSCVRRLRLEFTGKD